VEGGGGGGTRVEGGKSTYLSSDFSLVASLMTTGTLDSKIILFWGF
jgi:hypothetical protein